MNQIEDHGGKRSSTNPLRNIERHGGELGLENPPSILKNKNVKIKTVKNKNKSVRFNFTENKKIVKTVNPTVARTQVGLNAQFDRANKK